MVTTIQEIANNLAGLQPQPPMETVAKWVFRALKKLPQKDLPIKNRIIHCENQFGQYYTGTIPEDYIEEISIEGNGQATISGDTLRVTNKGKYTVWYKGYETDDDGFPVVPDGYEEAVSVYCQWEFYRAKMVMNPSADNAQVSKLMEMEWLNAAALLRGQVNTPSQRELGGIVFNAKKPQW